MMSQVRFYLGGIGLLILAPLALLSQELIPYRVGEKWGYSDVEGNIQIPPQFENAQFFIGDLAKVQKNSKWGLIDRNGKKFLDYAYDIIYAARKSGRVIVCKGGDIDGHGGKWGFVSSYKGQEIELKYDLLRESGISNRLGFKKSGYWGLLDAQGREVLKAEYSIPWDLGTQSNIAELRPESMLEPYPKLRYEGAVLRLIYQGRWGAFNAYGNVLIPFDYAYLGPFREGLAAAVIEQSGRLVLGFINLKNEWVIAPQYEFQAEKAYHYRFSEGRVAVSREGKWGFMDAQGRLKVSFQYADLGPFKSERALVNLSLSQLNPDWRVIDTQGRLIRSLPPECDPLDYSFRNGFLRIRRGDQYGYLNEQGILLDSIHYQIAQTFKRGKAQIIYLEDGQRRWNLIDERGKKRFAPHYDAPSKVYPSFGRHYFVLAKKGQWGIVDAQERGYIPFEYKAIRPPTEEVEEILLKDLRIAVKKGSYWGFVNMKNKVKIPFQFEDARAFRGEYAKVKLGQQWGFINREGKKFFEP